MTRIWHFFYFLFTVALFLDHFTTYIKILSKSVKFQISTQNQNSRASLRFGFFSWKLFKIDLIFFKK